MNRKKSNRKSTAKKDRASTPDPVASSRPVSAGSENPVQRPAAIQVPARGPSPAVRACLSGWLLFHLLAITVSFTSVVEPSAIHAQLSKLVHPYLRPTHFAADDRPVYLAHGDASEQPHRLQVTTASPADFDSIDSIDTVSWRTVGPNRNAGLAVSDRVARWLSTAAMLAENDQPSLVAELLLPIIEDDMAVTAIRIVRLPTDLSDIDAEAESPYVARVIRSGDLVSLVQLNPARLSSPAVSSRAETSDQQDLDPEGSGP